MKKLLFTLILTAFTTTSFAASNWKCVGTEPFWGATILDNKVVFASPELERPVSSSIVSLQTAAGVGPDFAFVVKTQNLTATVVSGACTDGMSDNEYTHHIVIDRGNTRVLYGCCNQMKR